MNDRILKDIRRILEQKRHEQFGKASDGDYPEGVGGAMLMVDDVAKAKQSEELLKMLPKPEYDIVKKYRAVVRASQVDFESTEPGRLPNHALRSEAGRLEAEAKEAVQDRIERREDGDVVILVDPITKMKYHLQKAGGMDQQKQVENAIERFAHDIINYGLDRP